VPAQPSLRPHELLTSRTPGAHEHEVCFAVLALGPALVSLHDRVRALPQLNALELVPQLGEAVLHHWREKLREGVADKRDSLRLQARQLFPNAVAQSIGDALEVGTIGASEAHDRPTAVPHCRVSRCRRAEGWR
jgi:hypothetical protein